jgi:hypothetical protein
MPVRLQGLRCVGSSAALLVRPKAELGRSYISLNDVITAALSDDRFGWKAVIQ